MFLDDAHAVHHVVFIKVVAIISLPLTVICVLKDAVHPDGAIAFEIVMKTARNGRMGHTVLDGGFCLYGRNSGNHGHPLFDALKKGLIPKNKEVGLKEGKGLPEGIEFTLQPFWLNIGLGSHLILIG